MRKSTPRCGARTRAGHACKRKALKNGRCPNHGGLSTGPRTPEGRNRIAAANRKRWEDWRQEQVGAEQVEFAEINFGPSRVRRSKGPKGV